MNFVVAVFIGRDKGMLRPELDSTTSPIPYHEFPRLKTISNFSTIPLKSKLVVIGIYDNMDKLNG